MPITITAAPSVPDDSPLVAVPFASDAPIDDELADQGFEGKLGQTARVNGRIAVGVGPADAVDPEVIRRASAALVMNSASTTCTPRRLGTTPESSSSSGS